MSYQVIARRYRPQRFEEVVGQESVAATLLAGIHQDRIAHAYLFTGPRGIGKTSMARIFAKALNCPQAGNREQPREEWGRPCNGCGVCESIHSGQDIDVVEMDGASHRGIDDVRTVIESVTRPATRCQYKIFIIDEVHMLTKEAFNALLKTLEEPPPHVKFIFATTEAHRIPETVLSRCQRFDFHPIGEEAIVRRLEQILKMEEREAEDGLLERVARCGRGGLRDAQTLLDQVMTYSEGTLRVAELERITGRVPVGTVQAIAEAAWTRNAATMLQKLRECFASGADPALLLEQLLDKYRTAVHERVLAEGSGGNAESPDETPSLDLLIGSLQILLEAASKLRHSAYPELAIEVVLLKLSRLEEPALLEKLIQRLREVEQSAGTSEQSSPLPGPAGTTDSRSPAAAATPSRRGTGPASRAGGGAGPRSSTPRANDSSAPPATLDVPPERPSAKNAVTDSSPPRRSADIRTQEQGTEPPDFQRLLIMWEQIRIELESKHPDMAPFFKEVRPVPSSDESAQVSFFFGNDFFCRQMRSARRQAAFETLIRDVTGFAWRTRMEAGSPPRAESSAIQSRGHRPAPSPRLSEAEARAPETEVRVAEPAAPEAKPPVAGIAQDPVVKKSLDLFNGRLV